VWNGAHRLLLLPQRINCCAIIVILKIPRKTDKINKNNYFQTLGNSAGQLQKV
jgi:hypothetical protein